MSEWKTYKLGDFAEINPRVSLKQGSEYSFVEMKDLDATLKYVSPSVKKELKGGAKFQNGDTLFARITPCLENGKICQVKNLDNNVGFGSTEFLVFRGRKNISDTDFVYYLSRSEFVKNNAIQMMTGTSGRQRVEKSALEVLEVIVPEDLATQTQIAQILTSLDDKIELNLQMNQTLEAMAQAIFKEWFVDFKFPGFDGQLVDGLPKGWKIGQLSDLCIKITKGTTPTTLKKQFTSEGVNFIKVESINEVYGFIPEKFAFIDNETNELLKRSKIEENDILFTIAGTLGRIAIADTSILPANTNQAVAIIRCSFIDYINYVLFLLKSDSFISTIISKAVHAVQANLSLGVISDTEIVIPTIETLIEFNNTINPLMKKIVENNYHIKTLTQTRDTLLPKLMSGKIKVEV